MATVVSVLLPAGVYAAPLVHWCALTTLAHLRAGEPAIGDDTMALTHGHPHWQAWPSGSPDFLNRRRHEDGVRS